MKKSRRYILMVFVLLQSIPAHAGWLNIPERMSPNQEMPLSQKMPHNLKFHFGLFSAVGFVGVGYSYSFSSFMQVELGAGLGASGPQLSMMPRLFFGDTHRFTIGLGIALGLSKGYASPGLCFSCSGKFDSNTIWINADIAGYEYQHKSGLVLSMTIGLTALLWGYNRVEVEMEPYSREEAPNFNGAQIRIGVGYSF